MIVDLFKKARKILTEKIEDLHKLAKALLTYETLTGEEIENIINKNLYPKDKVLDNPPLSKDEKKIKKLIKYLDKQIGDNGETKCP